MRLVGIGGPVMAAGQGGLVAGGLGLFAGCAFALGHGSFPAKLGTETPRRNYVSNRNVMAAKKKSAQKTTKRKNAKSSAKALEKYQSMRDFTVTAEPSGKRPVARTQRLRFVIQKH